MCQELLSCVCRHVRDVVLVEVEVLWLRFGNHASKSASNQDLISLC